MLVLKTSDKPVCNMRLSLDYQSILAREIHWESNMLPM